MPNIRVLIVDDSSHMRRWITSVLAADSQIDVVGEAKDPFEARTLIKRYRPHVVTLDIEMPRMNGIKFLENIMRLHPMPVVMISPLFQKDPALEKKIFERGAADVVALPESNTEAWFKENGYLIVQKVKRAANKVFKSPLITSQHGASSVDATTARSERVKRSENARPSRKIIAIGASTGGTEAIEVVLKEMPANSPGIVVAIHIPETFSKPLADRLDKLTNLHVLETSGNEEILDGHVYIAPGDHHLKINKWGGKYFCSINSDPPVNRFRPSVDVLMTSVAQAVGSKAIGVMLTGMGRDGAKGMQLMQQTGAPTIAQDERTSLVFGMPKAVINLGAADFIIPLDKIANTIQNLYSGKKAT